MSIEQNDIPIPIAIKGDPNTACFETVGQFIQALPNFLVGLAPTSITNVIISNIQPLDADRNAIWFRLSNGGLFIGIYVFSEGTWVQMFPQPNGIFAMYGDSREVPTGFRLADETNPALPPGVGERLVQSWILNAGNTYYVYFQVTFIGL